jgi:Helicase conserved C-terminal domain
MLREWDDDALERLLGARPDLAFPAPTDFSQVASRATTRQSVADALAGLNAFELWVARRASAQGGAFSVEDLAEPGADFAAVTAAVDRLVDLALLWGAVGRWRAVRALAGLLDDQPDRAPPPANPPRFDAAPRRSATLVETVAAGSAYEFVRRVEALVEHCEHTPVRQTSTGGLSAREAKALATLLDLPSGVATAHLEVAESAGLVGAARRGRDQVLLPNEAYDSWRSTSPAEQWSLLLDAWLDRHHRSGARWLKSLCLDAFGDPVDGLVLGVPDLRRWLAWQRPRRAATADHQAATMLNLAGWVGVTGLGALAGYAKSGDSGRLDTLLPDRVEHVVVQADLTAVAPGPLTPMAARELGSLAEVESRGGATVYRFTVASLRQAYDLGWSVDDIASTLQARSRTPLPQPLAYLIQDLDRQPRQRADTAGHELRRPSLHRAPNRVPQMSADAEQEPADRYTPEHGRAVVAALRRSSSAEPALPVGHMLAPAELGLDSPITTLREAVETGETVWLSYRGPSGDPAERLVQVSSVDEGALLALDTRQGERLTVPVHRITAAHIIRGR